MNDIPRLKHTQIASYSSIKHFQSLILFSINGGSEINYQKMNSSKNDLNLEMERFAYV